MEGKNGGQETRRGRGYSIKRPAEFIADASKRTETPGAEDLELGGFIKKKKGGSGMAAGKWTREGVKKK